jgi:hypothetical protein
MFPYLQSGLQSPDSLSRLSLNPKLNLDFKVQPPGLWSLGLSAIARLRPAAAGHPAERLYPTNPVLAL